MKHLLTRKLFLSGLFLLFTGIVMAQNSGIKVLESNQKKADKAIVLEKTNQLEQAPSPRLSTYKSPAKATQKVVKPTTISKHKESLVAEKPQPVRVNDQRTVEKKALVKRRDQ